MSIGRRISITSCSGLALAIVAVGLERSDGIVDPNAWLVGFAVAIGLAVVGVFFVNRWWSLVPALTTVAAFYWGSATESPAGAASFGAFLSSEYVAPFLFFPIIIGIAVLSTGLVARAIWERRPQPGPTAGANGNEAVR